MEVGGRDSKREERIGGREGGKEGGGREGGGREGGR